jgi:putative hemolysin
MSVIVFEILLIFLLLLLNGVFAMSEIAVVSARKVRLQQRAATGDAAAAAALALAEEPTRFLSTVQIGISLIGIMTGAYGGATLAGAISSALSTVPALAPHSDALGLATVVLVITYFSLVIGELVPKRLGLVDPERVASLVARPMRTLSAVASPAVHLLSLSTDIILRLLGARQSTDPPVTEEEINILLDQGAEAGIFETAERKLLTSVFRLSDQQVEELMTPRPQMVWLDIDDPLPDLILQIAESRHSYFPVYETTQDNVIGVLAIKDLWPRIVAPDLAPPASPDAADGEPSDGNAAPAPGNLAANASVNVRELLLPPVFVPESMPVFQLLETFKKTGRHMALIIDEYGGVSGLITLIDVLEGIVGDMPDEGAESEPSAIQRQDGSWLLDGMLSIEEVKDLLDIALFPDEDHGDYHTLAGFLLHMLGRIPSSGEYVDWKGRRFEVIDMDGHRIDKVLIQNKPAED